MHDPDFQTEAWMTLVELRLAAREAAGAAKSQTRLTSDLAARAAEILEDFLNRDKLEQVEPVPEPDMSNVHVLRRRSF
ncbi:hypothetical protein [Aureimonas psammosilenae]|uniref:hypothetical protein n=1 Tax=Aureimonas psammosilenae TaxID=2495496 RepID=UPI0012610A99|nr:hypothetical protein [Aureimonas psammosilenae]